jgi:tetratricopeptide (TPR) repeat protein
VTDICDRNSSTRAELILAREAVERGEPLVARSHFLRAILRDSTPESRGEYAAFLAKSGEYASAVAEYSRILEIAESRRDFPGLIEISWRMSEVYWGWGEQAQAVYFLEYAVLLEAQMLVHRQAGIEFQGGETDDLSRVSSQLGVELLRSMGRGNETQEAVTWLACGILEWVQGEPEESLRSLRTGLSLARKLHRDELVADFFLWLGRVCRGWEQPALSQMSLRRSAAWGGKANRSRREFELTVRQTARRQVPEV